MGLKLIFLVVTRAVPVLGLSQRESWRKDAKIVMLCHQLAAALRERPRARSRLTWPDRAWLALLAGTLPTGRLVIVAPSTVWQILKDAGTGPAPRRYGPGRTEFLRSQAQGIPALDFLDRTLIWNQRHLMMALREYQDFYNTRRPHRALSQAAPLRPPPDRITDFDPFPDPAA